MILLEERFWPKVLKTEADACWVWTGSLDNHGYGQFNVGGRPIRAHRIAWELTFGPVPPGLEVCHNCPGGDNPACVNPAHLFVDTHKANMEDMRRKGRHRYSAHRGEQNGNTRLTGNQIIEIRRFAAAGESQRSIARAFMVAQTTVSGIMVGRTWGWLKEAV